MKFTFDNSLFVKLWTSQEGRTIMKSILDDPSMIKPNYLFWRSKFLIDPQVTPTAPNGTASFTSEMRQLQAATLMDFRAPLGDSKPIDVAGVARYTATIPEFISNGSVETALEREDKKKRFEQFGDAQLLAQYAQFVLQDKIDQANQTLSHMSAQLLSTGAIDYQQGEGAKGKIYKASVPGVNFLKAGAKAWTDPECKWIDQVTQMVDDIRNNTGLAVALQLEINKEDFVNIVMKNPQVIERVRYTNTINNTPLPEQMILTKDMVMNTLATIDGFPQVVIIEEKQKDKNNGVVSGWKKQTAVLRPVGYAGFIRHTDIYDTRLFTKEYTNPANVYNFTPAMDGLAIVRNSVIVNGNFKEWHTDLILPAVPSLDEFLAHYIIDIATANE